MTEDLVVNSLAKCQKQIRKINKLDYVKNKLLCIKGVHCTGHRMELLTNVIKFRKT